MDGEDKGSARCVLGVVVAVVLSLTLSGCSAATRGGDTTCAEYKKMSTSAREEAVTALLSENGDTPSNGMISLSIASALLFCNTVGTDKSVIREING